MTRHRLDPVSLLCGLAFSGAAIFLLVGQGGWPAGHLRLVWALAAVTLGLALALSGRRREEEPSGGLSPPEGTPEG